MFARDMHHIQKEIITSLAQTSPQRFSQLQPAQVANNTFSYHLKKLLQSGYIELKRTGYVATRKALKTLQYSEENEKRTTTPVFLSAVYVTNTAGKVLLLKRNTQPFVGYYSVPAGVVHQGEHLDEAAKRELREKALIVAERVQFAGVMDFQYLEQESSDLFVHTVAMVYTHKLSGTGKQLEGLETRYGTLFWSDLSEEFILPEVHTMAQLVKKSQSAPLSIDYAEPLMIHTTAPVSKK